MTERERRFFQEAPMWPALLGAFLVALGLIGSLLYNSFSVSADVGRAEEMQADMNRRIAAVESGEQHLSDTVGRNAAAIAGLTSALTIVESQVEGARAQAPGGH